ncbi:hypothetical protein A4R43_15295 [Amycolatopsis albispora]|uniref:Uncharacterized protein n=1 Tax=Amycolatopsis albispora TaxID=1804986 RepID=A0A344L6P9_9PSEU|nr:hypothetical protein A4R43_15295 [Amycolatopsis albispora]
MLPWRQPHIAERFPIRLATDRPGSPRLIRRSFTVNTTTAGNPLFSHPYADEDTSGPTAAATLGATYQNLFREPGARDLPKQRTKQEAG